MLLLFWLDRDRSLSVPKFLMLRLLGVFLTSLVNVSTPVWTCSYRPPLSPMLWLDVLVCARLDARTFSDRLFVSWYLSIHFACVWLRVCKWLCVCAYVWHTCATVSIFLCMDLMIGRSLLAEDLLLDAYLYAHSIVHVYKWVYVCMVRCISVWYLVSDRRQ